MIKSILIRNFQSYKEAYIDLSNGFNVINGPTNQGKSVIVRALRWVFKNSPQGFTFHSHFAEAENDPTIITVSFDNDQFVTRFRSNTENYYSCSTHKKLEALRGNVPDEIKKIIQIEDINIQSQFDKIFLLDQPASHVGKYLNDVLDLTVIDTANKNINSMLKENARNIKQNKTEIDTLNQTVNSLSWVDSFNENLLIAEKLEQTIRASNINLSNIRRAYEEITQKNVCLTGLDKLISVKDSLDEVLRLIPNIDFKKNKLALLKSLHNSLTEISLSKTKLDNIILCANKVDEILIKNKEKEDLIQKKRDVILLDGKSMMVEKKLDALEITIETKKKEYLKSTRGLCPLCGNKTGDRI
jgi:DNA repair protein SbcC/Rad50